jgi:succinate dehydrogenase/fumarate reductase flavoprotein subunit
MSRSQLETDVVVVGGGMGGVIAATRAGQLGARVVLIEATGSLGGTAVHSAGSIHVWGAHSVNDYVKACPTVDPVFAEVLVHGFRPLVDWLDSLNAPGRFSDKAARGRALENYLIGGLAPLQKVRWFAHLGERFTGFGGKLLLNTRVKELVVHDGTVKGITVKGIIASSADGETEISASRVVLASGGFQANPVLLQRYIPGSSSHAVLRALPTNRGDALTLALAAGAATSPQMDAVYGHLLPDSAAVSWSNGIDPAVITAYYTSHGIALNSRGERFVDEGAGEYSAVTANIALKQPDGALWVLMDQEVRRQEGKYDLPWSLIRPSNLRYAQFLRFMRLRRFSGSLEVTIDSVSLTKHRGGLVIKEKTLEGLIRRLVEHGLPGEATRQTIEEYNKATKAGRADQLTVPRSMFAQPLQHSPFYAVRVGVGISMTNGGLRIDTTGRVLNEQSEPIPGLFATPGTAGGIFGLHYGGALAACGIFGWIVGSESLRNPAGTRSSARLPRLLPHDPGGPGRLAPGVNVPRWGLACIPGR